MQSQSAAPATTEAQPSSDSANMLQGFDEEDEEALMQRALEMSMRDMGGANSTTDSAPTAVPDATTTASMNVDEEVKTSI